jgi:hypothetical protein
MEKIGIFYAPLVFLCLPTWYIFWLKGVFCPFWYVVPRNIWQPCFQPTYDYEHLLKHHKQELRTEVLTIT